jgi:hypothetical protein
MILFILRRFFLTINLILFLLAITGCDPEIIRQHTAVLAADTALLNDEIEKLNKSRHQIEIARARLTQIIDLETLTSEQKTTLAIGAWSALKDDPAFKQRLQFFENIKSITNTASNQDDEIEKLDSKISEVSDVAKGQRSEQLAETSKDLAALSVKNSLSENLSFLVGYVKSVQEGLEKAKKDSSNANQTGSNKSDALINEVQKN